MTWLIASILFCGSQALTPDWRTPEQTSGTTSVEGQASAQDQTATHRAWFDALTRNIPEQPFDVILGEGTNCGLELGLNPDVMPILASEDGVFLAASTLGSGRILAFSGQDYLSSDTASSFIGKPHNDGLVHNGVRWASASQGEPRVLVDNAAIARMLRAAGLQAVRVASLLEDQDPEDDLEARDWSAAALAEVDVAVVLVNEWDPSHVAERDIASLRAFVQQGGGLLIGGSSYHWSGEDPELFPANIIAQGSGIRWLGDELPDLASARLSAGELSSSLALWQAYLEGDVLDALQLSRLSALFRSALGQGRTGELDQALVRLIAETPVLPASATDPLARLSAAVASSLGAYAWPAAHPWAAGFPGLVDAKVKRIERSLAIDASWTGARPLGLYAPPGELLTLHVSPEHVTRDLWIAVGDDHDDLRQTDAEHWARAPYLSRGFRVDAKTIRISNPYGGPLYLIIPKAFQGSIQLRVQGAIPMAVYTLGETKLAGWKRELDGGAPQALLQARGRMRFLVQSAAAMEVEYPDWVLQFWSDFHASHSQLAQEPTPRRFESHMIFDPQVGSGYANASPVASSMNGGHLVDRIVFPLDAEELALTTKTGEDDYWTVGHELGHQFQTDDWIGGDLTEVAVNLFSLYTQNGYIHGGTRFQTVGFEDDHYDHASLIDFRWDDVGEWEKLQLYRQLVLVFGWDAFERTFASYYDPAYPRETFGSHIDGFAIRFSAIIKRDLSGFLAHWEYPLSDQAAKKIRNLGFKPWMPPGW